MDCKLLLLQIALVCWSFRVSSGADVGTGPDAPFNIKSVDGVKISKDETKYRLPNDTKPETYDISLVTQIDLGLFTFSGIVQIGIVVLKKTRDITVHARQLTIESVHLKEVNEEDIPLLDFTYDDVTEFLSIHTKERNLLQSERYKLIIKYNGALRSGVAGFYRLPYFNSVGKETWLAATQFESTNARHGFPCYDEPALKANFTINITHGGKYSALSNMPETRTKNLDGTVTTRFATTPKMSTYLIAFVVSDFEFKENAPERSFRHRVYSSPKYIEKARIVLLEGEKLLTEIGNYLQVPFSLPKMDQVLLPNFGAGGMENFGLVIYGDSFLFWEQANDTNFVVRIVAHEFAHQWFGNLVSVKWWSYLWLKEGFATLFEYIGTDLVHPEWNYLDNFATEKLQRIFPQDASTYTHPMTNYVESPTGIVNLGDNISYAKSASVIRMFMYAFSEKSFKKGLNYYLNDKAYQAADEDDLFLNLDKAVKEDKTLDKDLLVKDLFGSWSNQKGFPLLKIDRIYENGSITISQEKYTNNKTSETADESTWWIPYNFASANNPSFNDTSPTGWLPQGTKSTLIEPNSNRKLSPEEWVVFNKQQTGYYRVMYDQRNYQLLSEELKSGDMNKIHPINRAQIIDDLNYFVQSGRAPHNIFFDVIKYLSKETKYAPWVSAQRAIIHINSILVGSSARVDFRKFIRSLVKPFYQSVGYKATDNEQYFVKNAREIATNLACEFGVNSCLDETYELFVSALNTSNGPFKHNRALIYKNGIRSASATEIHTLWDRFIHSKNQDERMDILTSFAFISDENVLQQHLNRSMIYDKNIRLTGSEREQIIISVVQGSQSGLMLTIQLLLNHIDVAKERFGTVDSILFAIADNIFSNEAHRQFSSLLTLVKDKTLTTGKILRKIHNDISEKFGWLNIHKKNIEAYVVESLNVKSTPNIML